MYVCIYIYNLVATASLSRCVDFLHNPFESSLDQTYTTKDLDLAWDIVSPHKAGRTRSIRITVPYKSLSHIIASLPLIKDDSRWAFLFIRRATRENVAR